MAEAGWRYDDPRRTAAMDAYEAGSLRDSAELRAITDFAARLCDAPIALVSMVEDKRQDFLARTGLTMTETPREQSFCAHAALGADIMVVADAAADPRFADNPLVTGEPGIRFYAGAPLVAADGMPLGALCVIDTVPRAGLTDLQREGLALLAADVQARLSVNRDGAASRAAERDARRAAGDSDARFRILADTMPQMVWSTRPDGYHDYYNARWYEFTGMPDGSTDGEEWNGMFHPDDQARAWTIWRHSLTTGDPYEIEYRLRHFDDTYRWVLGRALPMRDAGGAITRWFGTCTDIHEQKLAMEEREIISQELSHRIKNIFAVIAGLIGFAGRSRPEFAPAADDLRRRVTALGRAHDFVRPHSPHSRPSAQQDSLHGLLGELFSPYGEGRVVVGGDDVPIDDRSATPLALLFHELATNASKYGALSAADGHVALTVTGGDPAMLRWREEGGPAPAPPSGEGGFGTQLIELSAVRQLGATVRRTWHDDGLEMELAVPAASLSRATPRSG